ncbi:MAG: hypothetical protein H0T62_00520 [Parachlamydiaceae bacterium]|nr:hypothetical protein [Parachlamydiaceae bacterium]
MTNATSSQLPKSGNSSSVHSVSYHHTPTKAYLTPKIQENSVNAKEVPNGNKTTSEKIKKSGHSNYAEPAGIDYGKLGAAIYKSARQCFAHMRSNFRLASNHFAALLDENTSVSTKTVTLGKSTKNSESGNVPTKNENTPKYKISGKKQRQMNKI